METISSSCCRQCWIGHIPSNYKIVTSFKRSRSMLTHRRKMRSLKVSAAASSDIILAANSAATVPNDISWQIIVGSLAGITPFIVAGIEFGKRIIMQKNCDICRGSGLLLKEDSYIRCPNCGGFLPWQSWKRFFTG